MKLQFFRSYDWIWKGALPLSLHRASASHEGPWPAKLVVGVKAPVDHVTGMSVDLPTMDRRVGDLLRVLSFSLSAEDCPELEALLRNMAKRLTEALRAETPTPERLEVLHLELRVKNAKFLWKEGRFESLIRIKSRKHWPEGYFLAPLANAQALKNKLKETPAAGSNIATAVDELSLVIEGNLDFQEWLPPRSKIRIRN